MTFDHVRAAADTKEDALLHLKASVPRFAEVAPGIYRSGLLHEDSAPLLKELGVKTVINMHDDERHAALEDRFLSQYGIEMYWEPWEGLDEPSPEQMDRIQQMITDVSLHPLVYHCQRGAERTGLTTAIYRVKEEQWPVDQALDEMRRFNFREFWYGHLKKYLYDYTRTNTAQKVREPGWAERTKTGILSGIYKLRKVGNLFSSR